MTPAFIILLFLTLTVDSKTAQSSSVTFYCGGSQCPSGQDCLLVDGTSRCMDPCDHYTPLDDAWRATDVRSPTGHCDKYTDFSPLTPYVWQGWYRLFLGNSSVQMPERCIHLGRCGTAVTLWLKTPHPQLSAGIIKAQVCGTWTRGCCHYKEKPIHVKACPGNYYVYKITKPTSCNRAYCADVNTKTPVCNTCTAAQTCVINGTVWRCEETTSPTVIKVTFSTSLVTEGETIVGPFDKHTTLVFKHVFTNIGDAYNSKTGVFTAPVKGVYHFEWHINRHANGASSVVSLMKGSEVISSALENQASGYQSSSQASSLVLGAGEAVYLRLWEGDMVHDNSDHITTFSGDLLYTV